MPLQLSQQSRIVVDPLSRLAKTIALPHEYPPTRLPTQNAIERTAVTQFQLTGTVATDSVNAGIIYAMLLRHPAIPLWLSTTFTAMGIEYGGVAQEAATINLRGPVVFANLTLDQAASFPSSLPNGLPSNCIPFASDEVTGGDYFYVPPGAQIYCRFSSSSAQASGSIDVNLMQWNAPGDESFWTLQTATFAASTSATTPVGVVPGNGGWFRWVNATVSTALPSAGTLQVSCGWYTGGSYTTPTGSVSGIYPAGLVDEWATTTVPFTNTRVTAAGLLLSNVTKVLNKEGTVLAARLTPDQNSFRAPAAPLSSRNVMEKYFGPLEQGVYTFTSPTPESMVFVDSTTGSDKSYPYLSLNRLGMTNLVRLTDPSVSDTTTMAYTVDWHVEFRTTSVLFPLGVTATPLEEFQAAQVSLAMVGNFFENPAHLPAIAGLVGSAASTVAKSLGPVLLEHAVRKIGMKVPPKVTMKQAVPGGPPPKTLMPKKKSGKKQGKVKRS